jgi:Yip1 domain
VTTPLPAGTAPGAGASPIDQSFAQGIFGVVRRPRATFQRVVSHPQQWGWVLVVTTLVSAASGAALMASPVGQQALVDQWERTAASFGRQVDNAAYARMEELSQHGVGYAVITAVVSGPVLTLAVAGALFVAFSREARFRQVLAVATYAGVILALRQIIAAPIGYLQESTSNATSLGSLFSTLDEASPIARFLGALDLFVLWWAVVLAIGVSVLYHRRARSVAVTFVGLYAALALLLAIAMAVAGGSA